MIGIESLKDLVFGAKKKRPATELENSRLRNALECICKVDYNGASEALEIEKWDDSSELYQEAHELEVRLQERITLNRCKELIKRKDYLGAANIIGRLNEYGQLKDEAELLLNFASNHLKLRGKIVDDYSNGDFDYAWILENGCNVEVAYFSRDIVIIKRA